MGEIFQTILTTVIDFPGNLIYHLVLAFSVAGAFQAALNLWRESGFPQGKRMVTGLGLLLVARVILFITAGLSAEGVTDPHSFLPVVDRAITALSIVVIIWLWAFPEPMRSADAATGLLALLTTTVALLSLVWWSDNSSDANFNQSWLDIGWEIYSLILLGMGVVLLLIRKPNSWGRGVAMLAILISGHLLQLIAPLPDSDFSASVRLAQMAAYPILLALPHRFQIPKGEVITKQPQPLIQERTQYNVSPQVFQSILSIGAQKSFPEICQTLTRTLSEAMLADVCLALLPPNNDGQMTVQCGYDLIREKELPGYLFEGHEIPLLSSAMEQARPLRLPASSTSRDLFTLGIKLELGRAGHLLASFVSDKNNIPLVGIILLSPYSNRGWSNEDQAFLSDITDGLAQILQRSREWTSLQDDLTKNRQNLQAFQAMLAETQEENANLRKDLKNYTEEALHGLDENFAILPVNQTDLQDKISRLTTENERLEELVESLVLERNSSSDSPGTEQLEEELRLTLEETARLKTRLSDADQKLLNLQRESNEPSGLSDHQIEVFTSIAQELRQPMSSIIGYTDLLLGESIGILGALQRKFLERVKASTDRMEVMLSDLYQVTALNGNQYELHPEMVDLGIIIDDAILAASPQLRDRHIILRVDMPDILPRLRADRDALGQIFIHLLQNAGDASPMEGEIILKASTYATDEEQEYVLVQVSDQGGGIPTDELPRVFSRLYRADNPLIEGVGDTGVGLSIAKTLVEAHNGRIWVDTEVGKGSTFSVLIPKLNGNHGELTL
jgi:signal transduction histidine kinase